MVPLSGWSLIRVPLSGWSVFRAVCHHGVSHRGGLPEVVSHQGVFSRGGLSSG